MRPRPLFRRKPFHCCWKAATFWVLPRPALAKPLRSRLPTLDYLLEHPELRKPKKPRVLVLAPTRELASQIADSFANIRNSWTV